MQEGVGLVVLDVMPIFMIIPRYSHNYAQFCQLLNSNLFTHCKYLCSREKPLVKPMAPGLFSSYQSPLLYLLALFLLCLLLFTLHLYIKNTKNIILSYLSDLTLVSDHEGIDNPLSRWLLGVICFVQVRGTRA